MKYYAIVQKDRVGYFTWLREGKQEFAPNATLVKVLEGRDSGEAERAAEKFLEALRRSAVQNGR